MAMTISQEYLKSILHYNPETGVFTWLVRKSRSVRVGSIAGSLHKYTGYWRILIDGEEYLAHRLAWFYMTGSWPLKETDHRDTDKLNNRFSNLREANESQNQMNRPGRYSDGIKGVHYNKATSKWRAAITINNRKTYIGEFQTQEEACVAYAVVAKKLHGEFYYEGVRNG